MLFLEKIIIFTDFLKRHTILSTFNIKAVYIIPTTSGVVVDSMKYGLS